MNAFEIMHSISLAYGQALSHTGSILAGTPMVWADETQRADLHAHRRRVDDLMRRIGR